MSTRRFGIAAAVAVAVAASVFTAAPADAGKKMAAQAAMPPAPAAAKLEGAWIAKVVEVEGQLVAPPSQWTYVLSPDSSGRRASGHGTIDVGLYTPLDEMADAVSPLLIDLVMTGPTTGTFNSVWYGLKKGPTSVGTTAEIIYIGVNHGDINMVAPGKSKNTHNIAFYGPESDEDHDGLPDAGAQPLAPPIVVHTEDTRLGQ
jgi:hypothetical protein